LGDPWLLNRVADRDETALALLYERYAQLIYALALRILQQPELAEDLVQETFVRVWRRASTFRSGPGGVPAWLFRIARNLALDQLRRQAARPHTIQLAADSDGETAGHNLVDPAVDVAEQGWQRVRRDQVRNALTQLPLEQRQVIELAYFAGLTHRELANQLGVPLGTVKSRLRRGLQTLSRLLPGL
jgi:RNA polymerase sigma-70 factor (ECF subfamily)